MTRPRLYVFTISHYCEKARWALEYKGIDYELVTLMPGPHALTVRKFSRSSVVPLLVDGEHVVQGSTQIIDYVEQRYSDRALTPSQPEARAEAAYWEEHLTQELGDPLRRFVYSHAFRDDRFVRALFLQGGPWWGRPFYAVMLPLLFKLIRRMYNVTPAAVSEDIERLDALFQRLDARLASRRYLAGNEFSRADLTLASLAAPLVQPGEHPTKWAPQDLLPRALLHQSQRWRESLTAERVRQLYREQRVAPR
jgi:glutathione S-transferase